MDRTLPILALAGITLLVLLHFLGKNEVITGKLFNFSARLSHLICNYWLIICSFSSVISYIISEQGHTICLYYSIPKRVSILSEVSGHCSGSINPEKKVQMQLSV